MSEPAASQDPAEIARFAAASDSWWAPDGTFASLHRMNPARLQFIRANLCGHTDRPEREDRPLAGLAIADIGCGGGLLSEPLARMGADVTGIDAEPGAIAAAQAHAAGAGLGIGYRCAAAEDLAEEQPGAFDAVCALEIVEHVADRASFLGALARLVRPGGAAILSTLNRTRRSYWLGIVGAERVLGWLPPGTHDWNRFVTPDELEAELAEAGLAELYRSGMVFDPKTAAFRLDPRNTSVNYISMAWRPA